MASTTTSTLDDLMQYIIAEADLWFKQSANLRNIITNFTIPDGVNSIKVPSYAELTASTVTEGTELETSSALTSSSVEITPSEKAVWIPVTDRTLSGTPSNVIQIVGQAAGLALAKAVNRDIWTLFDGFTTNTVGTTDTNITLDLIHQAKQKLILAGAPGPYHFVVTPYVYKNLLDLFSQTTTATYKVSNAMTDQVAATGAIENYFGVNIVVCNDLATGVGDAADAKCGMFSPLALAYAQKWDVKIEPQRNAKLIGYDMVASISYGVAEIKDAWGVEVLVDNNDAES